MEEREIVVCKCGAYSYWIVSDKWICCHQCGQEHLLCESINVPALNAEIALKLSAEKRYHESKDLEDFIFVPVHDIKASDLYRFACQTQNVIILDILRRYPGESPNEPRRCQILQSIIYQLELRRRNVSYYNRRTNQVMGNEFHSLISI